MRPKTAWQIAEPVPWHWTVACHGRRVTCLPNFGVNGGRLRKKIMKWIIRISSLLLAWCLIFEAAGDASTLDEAPEVRA